MDAEALKRMARFIIDHGNACTEWTGGKDADGYPMFWYQGKTERASRCLWCILYGAIPDGLIVRHTCDNPECLNPSHLQLGTHKDNTADAIKHNRLVGPRKMDEEKQELLVKYSSLGLSRKALADLLGVSVSTLYNYLSAMQKRQGNYTAQEKHWNWREK